MSKPFEASRVLKPEDISRKIWRNYKLAIGLGAVGLALGASMFGVYKTAAGDARPSIIHIQPGNAHMAEQLVEIYEQSP